MKRGVPVVLAGALAALPACAPTGYDASNTSGTETIANAAGQPSNPPSEEDTEEIVPDVDLAKGLVGKEVDRMGEVVSDEEGWLLYRFDNDSDNPPTTNCVDECEKIWPPVYTDGNLDLDGVSEEKIGTVDRPDGTKQVTLGGWPLYYYIGDKKPGAWKGQGVDGKWYVAQPDGTKNLECLPEGKPKPVVPPDDDKDGGAAKEEKEEDSGYGY
jgi:predicted lipoprotein with Yx(FWY)xxD motif